MVEIQKYNHFSDAHNLKRIGGAWACMGQIHQYPWDMHALQVHGGHGAGSEYGAVSGRAKHVRGELSVHAGAWGCMEAVAF